MVNPEKVTAFKKLIHSEDGYSKKLSPSHARYISALAKLNDIEFEDIDDGNGYLFRISKNGKSAVLGGGMVAAYPLNSATAHGIARDKKHTKSLLSAVGLPVIKGRLFFLPNRYERLQPKNTSVADAISHANSLGFPVFCKPNVGSRGDFAEIIHSEEDLRDYIDRVSTHHTSILVEEYVIGEEYRVFVQDSESVYFYKKIVPSIIGNGKDSLAKLLSIKNDSTSGFGISPIPENVFTGMGISVEKVLSTGQSLPIPGRQNISGDGEWDEFTTHVEKNFGDLAIQTCQHIGLRIGAVDIFVRSEVNGSSKELLVIEVNSSPGITILEKAEREDIIYKIWSSIIEEILDDR